MSLAASAATSGLRVLLIDANLRHPSTSSCVKKAVGLVDLLLENANFQEVIKFRECEDVALFATSVLPGHIKRQSDMNARS
jgi:Mrp family chromosome partitioning ATPase